MRCPSPPLPPVTNATAPLSSTRFPPRCKSAVASPQASVSADSVLPPYAPGKRRSAASWRRGARSPAPAHLVDMPQQVGRILIDAIGARALELLLAVAAGEQADPEG